MRGAGDPGRAFQYLGSLPGADLRAQMGECSEGWVRLAREVDGITERPSQAEVDRLWDEGILRPATELGERARWASNSRPSTALSSRRAGDKVLDRATERSMYRIACVPRYAGFTHGAPTCVSPGPPLIARVRVLDG